MPDYSKTSIYKIVCTDPNVKECYVGSTCNLSRRKTRHKNDCYYKDSKCFNYPVYKFIRENGGFENWTVIQLHEFSCENKQEKDKVEREWIEKIKPELNGNVPAKTKEEYKKYHNEYAKKWQKTDKYKLYHEEYVKTDKYKKYQKDYKSTEKYKNSRKEKITCECGCKVSRGNKATHRKSLKHKKLMELKES